MPNYMEDIYNAVSPGVPVAGELAATTVGAPLSAASVPCKHVQIFPTTAAADVYIGDADSQPNRLPGMPVIVRVSDVHLLWGRLSEGGGSIPWLAITEEEEA